MFLTHYFSENLVAPVIEPGPLDLWPGTLTTRPQRWSSYDCKYFKVSKHSGYYMLELL
jgi:hypothetical protein